MSCDCPEKEVRRNRLKVLEKIEVVGLLVFLKEHGLLTDSDIQEYKNRSRGLLQSLLRLETLSWVAERRKPTYDELTQYADALGLRGAEEFLDLCKKDTALWPLYRPFWKEESIKRCILYAESIVELHKTTFLDPKIEES